ncbi:hypothetical protein [Candidatus Protochlamydia amoebophila]|uniref:Uncharacterized protein n=1 Tax=Candidatus Protochlamydia amoebophila TaxID=362787 RepID=A0A0C1JK76_9BACT|nr:hypothetical protein [Candidatus Protochlamydia amoebophila]KIC71690.1 hypothetical protein DB44_DE00160 [Candidatus Protochlamydia amoebophila]
MQNLFDLFEHRSLKEQLILWLLSLVLLPLIWTTFISYELSKKLILDQSTNHLKALSLHQAQLIETYFKEKEKNAAYLAKDQTLSTPTQAFKKALAAGLNSSQYQLLKTHYQSLFAFETEQRFFDSLKRWEIGSLNGLMIIF